MLSTTAEYALRMMVLLAAQGQRSATCAALSASGHIPQQYASKVLNMLRQAGLVKGQRGRYGGFVLACDPTQVTMLDVVHAIEPPRRMAQCPLGLPTQATQLCAMHRQIDQAIAQFEQGLQGMTLSQVVEQGGQQPLCEGAASAPSGAS